jgi:hypothetical protein
MSTVEEAQSGAASGFAAAAVATTFGTYMLADTLSNFLQHPTQKVRVVLRDIRGIRTALYT